MLEVALLTFGVLALIAAAIVVRRLGAVAARLVEVVDAVKTVREEIRRLG